MGLASCSKLTLQDQIRIDRFSLFFLLKKNCTGYVCMFVFRINLNILILYWRRLQCLPSWLILRCRLHCFYVVSFLKQYQVSLDYRGVVVEPHPRVPRAWARTGGPMTVWKGSVRHHRGSLAQIDWWIGGGVVWSKLLLYSTILIVKITVYSVGI